MTRNQERMLHPLLPERDKMGWAYNTGTRPTKNGHKVGVFYVMKQEPITSEKQIANGNSPFQQKRIKMKALLRLKHLERKSQRQAARKREKETRTRI